MTKEIYISVDVEADGTHPGQYSMSSFGAFVAGSKNTAGELERFDYENERNLFYAELSPISNYFIPEAAAVSGLDRDALIKNGVNPAEALTNFCNWVVEKEKEYGGRAVFSAYPLGYDWMWMYWYICEYSTVPSPFGHSAHYDMKTGFAEKSGNLVRRSVKRNMPKHLLSTLPHTHNALDDAIEQGILMMNLLEWEGSK